ncbi:uncharacterized protein BT62DRAFT_302408 [Guyanagaster necrorhizus]|uniref:F-box domain-containing protein n=1 Tax=Guyanagaster necrorhizus TaxID=856835 RepID=A0A9P8AYE2_9AGAR|nr:uncharacterized protein BT62DRAFT_302408 [Guyanagaster necrorhizus MCA 3950]KAG7452405.1 hypothetical protein BT62DRAFT_302408 [Guyanagaster necrorhizus MCA 3950]
MAQTNVVPLLGTNHAPTEEERRVIEQSLEDHESELEHLLDEIQELQQTIHARQRAVEKIRDTIDAHYMLLRHSPMRTLPPEILGEIFQAYCDLHPVPDFSNWDYRRRNTLMKSRMELLHVCRRWRTIALSMPRVWSAFPLFARQSPLSNPNFDKEMVNLWLMSSGRVPLDIYASYHEDSPDYTATHLISQIHRCRRLNLEFQFHHNRLGSITWLSLPIAPMLTTLCFHSDRWADASMITWASQLFPTLPNLRDLDFNGPASVLNTASLGSLRILRCTLMNPEQFVGALKGLPLLEEMHVGHMPDATAPTSCTIHKTLKVLDMRWDPSELDAIPNLLRQLTLPALESLEIHDHFVPPKDIMDFLTRSACSLITLRMAPNTNKRHRSDNREHAILPCLQMEQNQSLRRLFIHAPNDSMTVYIKGLSPEILEYLKGPGLPHLTEIGFTTSTENISVVKEVIKRREAMYKDNLVKSMLSRVEIVLSSADQWFSGKVKKDDIKRASESLKNLGVFVDLKSCEALF